MDAVTEVLVRRNAAVLALATVVAWRTSFISLNAKTAHHSVCPGRGYLFRGKSVEGDCPTEMNDSRAFV